MTEILLAQAFSQKKRAGRVAPSGRVARVLEKPAAPVKVIPAQPAALYSSKPLK
jgi:hypothetical protein